MASSSRLAHRTGLGVSGQQQEEDAGTGEEPRQRQQKKKEVDGHVRDRGGPIPPVTQVWKQPP